MLSLIIAFCISSCIAFILIVCTDGYVLLSNVNKILIPFSENKPIHTTKLPWCNNLRNNYKQIQDEYINYTKLHSLQRFSFFDPEQQSVDTGVIPWDVIILRLYNKNTIKIHDFPFTYNLISHIPGCSFAMFSVLKPGKILKPHYGPYKGVVRYHLSIITPKDSNKCYLTLDDKHYPWVEGTDIMFDDTFLHGASNYSDQTRVVLFLDIKKQFNNLFINWFNSAFLYCAQFNSSVDNIVKNI
jgi:aspartyl/asparaginyl beta-hydroxylase (cupin superfamily)